MLFELIVFVLSVIFTFYFNVKWYGATYRMWPPRQSPAVKWTFNLLPLVSFVIFLFTLTVLASFDVVDSFYYILFYILLGYAWLYFGLIVMAYCFDLSWVDDALNLNNKAAIISVAGGFLGLTVIYSGANIGDGPGWWCVIFAGGLGLAAWVLTARSVNAVTRIFERITIERDIQCGIRIGAYLLASGIILGRASARDWTSFGMTVVEFADGWPVLLLTVFAAAVELIYNNLRKSRPRHERGNSGTAISISLGVLYIVIAIFSVLMLPLSENPRWDVI
jgi:hypothetical protein